MIAVHGYPLLFSMPMAIFRLESARLVKSDVSSVRPSLAPGIILGKPIAETAMKAINNSQGHPTAYFDGCLFGWAKSAQTEKSVS